jgi:hypothetical protein
MRASSVFFRLAMLSGAILVALTLVKSKAKAQAVAAQQGQWSAPATWQPVFSPVHMHLLPNGTVLMWDWEQSTQSPDSPTWIWDPTSNTVVNGPTAFGHVLFCTGHSLLPDGRLFVAGGGHHAGQNVRKTALYDFRAGPTGAWVAGPEMATGRWYPTVTTLASGEALIGGGESPTAFGEGVSASEVLTPSLTLRTLSATTAWERWYPFLFVAPNGLVFRAGGTTGATDTRATGYINPADGTWTEVSGPTAGGPRNYGSAVMYQPGKVLKIGGGDRTGGCGDGAETVTVAANSAETIDLSGAATWTTIASMAYGRMFTNATLLADGRVLVTGGNAVSATSPAFVKAAEIWNPSTGAWTSAGDAALRQGYHSAALLLPDATVLIGGGRPCGDYTQRQVYSPPYLYDASGSPAVRPTITWAPGTANYNTTFTVNTPEAATINAVTLLRLGSVTHHFNENQRFNSLTFTQSAAGSLAVSTPTDPRSAPPGHYMLFVFANGVPSVASIIQLAVEGSGTDFNRDGYPDLVWHNQTTGAIEIWHMGALDVNGFAVLDTAPASAGAGGSYRIRGLGDFNPGANDGRPDFAWQHDTTGELPVWLMWDATVLDTTHVNPSSIDPNWKMIGAADFDANGRDDLVFRHATTNQLAVWWMEGTQKVGGGYMIEYPVANPPVPLTISQSWRLAGTGDFNGDSRPDMIWQNDTTSQFAVWYMWDDKRLDTYAFPDVPTGWSVRAVADFDGDHHPDVLLRNGTQLAIWTYYDRVRLNTVIVNATGRDSAWTLVGAR